MSINFDIENFPNINNDLAQAINEVYQEALRSLNNQQETLIKHLVDAGCNPDDYDLVMHPIEMTKVASIDSNLDTYELKQQFRLQLKPEKPIEQMVVAYDVDTDEAIVLYHTIEIGEIIEDYNDASEFLGNTMCLPPDHGIWVWAGKIIDEDDTMDGEWRRPDSDEWDDIINGNYPFKQED